MLLIALPFIMRIALFGTDARRMPGVCFGYLGPRGLATALFGLMVLKDLVDTLEEDIINMV